MKIFGMRKKETEFIDALLAYAYARCEVVMSELPDDSSDFERMVKNEEKLFRVVLKLWKNKMTKTSGEEK